MTRLLLLLHAWVAIGLTAVLIYGVNPATPAGVLLIGLPVGALVALAVGLPLFVVCVGLWAAVLRR